jgi:choline dehydrogenase-like flavoprotein
MQFMPSTINIRDKNNLNSYVMDFRPGNKLIIDSIINFKKYLYPIKYLLNYFRKNMIFSNIFLTSRYSNLYIKINKDNSTNIFSKNKNLDLVFKKIHKKIFKFLAKEKLVLPIFYNYFPGFGSDFHYFGTIPMSKNKNKLSVNEKCQLKSNKNIYIIDGSVLDFKTNKYPLGIVMANARRIGEEIK